eukprot:TRINITY_DN73568_c0_g1_i1.p3 TRINITY_DN73568_c0_g1~~TRINITY_DN73568_c0_g1_i1.p3  ORF type:complete len:130 (+),score=12.94 TRINITY_DN73568_c0_g1_i1:40-390(+)
MSDGDDVDLGADAEPDGAREPVSAKRRGPSGKGTLGSQGHGHGSAVDDGRGSKSSRKRTRSASGQLFAAYDDYADVLDELDRQRGSLEANKAALPSKSGQRFPSHGKRRAARRKSA